jgi:hypothetical protein
MRGAVRKLTWPRRAHAEGMHRPRRWHGIAFIEDDRDALGV